MSALAVCEWFALCTNGTTQGSRHPVLGLVPCCDRCAAKLELKLEPLAPSQPTQGSRS